MSKFKNYGLWVALFSQFVIFYQALPLLGFNVPTIDMDALGVAVFAVVNVFVAFGIVSNPESGKWFKD